MGEEPRQRDRDGAGEECSCRKKHQAAQERRRRNRRCERPPEKGVGEIARKIGSPR